MFAGAALLLVLVMVVVPLEVLFCIERASGFHKSRICGEEVGLIRWAEMSLATLPLD